MQNAVDLSARATLQLALNEWHVRLHDHQLRACAFFDDADALVVVAVCVADQDDFGVAVFEAELFDTCADSWYVFFEIRVDENVARGVAIR